MFIVGINIFTQKKNDLPQTIMTEATVCENYEPQYTELKNHTPQVNNKHNI